MLAVAGAPHLFEQAGCAPCPAKLCSKPWTQLRAWVPPSCLPACRACLPGQLGPAPAPVRLAARSCRACAAAHWGCALGVFIQPRTLSGAPHRAGAGEHAAPAGGPGRAAGEAAVRAGGLALRPRLSADVSSCGGIVPAALKHERCVGRPTMPPRGALYHSCAYNACCSARCILPASCA